MPCSFSRLLVTGLCVATLAACAASRLPETSSSMADIYAGTEDVAHATFPASQVSARTIQGGDVDLSPYTREAATELTTRFPRVPNPTLVMFVFPHLSRGVPVPGYATTFPMFESAPYALPGETANVAGGTELAEPAQ